MRFVLIALLAVITFQFAYAQESEEYSSEEQTQQEEVKAPAIKKKKRRISEYHFQWFDPTTYRNSIGWERGASTIGVLAQDVINYSWWTEKGTTGYEVFVGFEKNSDSFNTTTTSAVDAVAATQTSTVTNSGTKNGMELTIGGGFKRKFYQSRWLQVYWGALGAVTYTTEADYATGTRTTVVDTTNPSDFTVTETGFGTVRSETDLLYSFGLKVGTEFYLKWFPQLALGFATGLLTTLGGDTTDTTTSQNRTFAVVGGTEQTPTTDTSTQTTVNRKPGIQAGTFGIGGTSFQFTGLFTIRYVW